MTEERTTDPSIFGLDKRVTPEWHDGLPHCAGETCSLYDGKRCEATGFRPSEHCEPALHSMRAWIDKARVEYAARCQEVHEETTARLRLARERDEARLSAKIWEETVTQAVHVLLNHARRS